jgi:hypothetical protein
MNKITLLTLMAFLPAVGHAQTATAPELSELLQSFIEFSNDTLIPFTLGVGFLFLVFGVLRYFFIGGADEESRNKGKSYIVSVIVGFIVILIFWGVINLLANSTGLAGSSLQIIPTVGVDID